MTILHGSWLIQSEAETLSPSGSFFLWGERWRRVDPLTSSDDQILAHPFCMDQDELVELLQSLQAASQLQWPIANVSLNAAEKSLQDRWQSFSIQLPSYSLPPVKKTRTKKQSVMTFLPQHSEEKAGIKAEGRRQKVEGRIQNSESKIQNQPTPSPSQEGDRSIQTSSLMLQHWEVQGISLSAAEAVQVLQSLPLAIADADESFMGGDLRFWSHVSRWSLDLLTRAKFVPLLDRTSEGNGANPLAPVAG